VDVVYDGSGPKTFQGSLDVLCRARTFRRRSGVRRAGADRPHGPVEAHAHADMASRKSVGQAAAEAGIVVDGARGIGALPHVPQ